MGGLFNPINYTPARLQLVAGVIAVLAIAGLGLTTWALIERAGRLQAKVDVVRLQDQVDVLGRQIETQNSAIDGWKTAAAERTKTGAIARQAAEAAVAGLAPELTRLQGLLVRHRATGEAAGCSDALAEIRRGLRP